MQATTIEPCPIPDHPQIQVLHVHETLVLLVGHAFDTGSANGRTAWLHRQSDGRWRVHRRVPHVDTFGVLIDGYQAPQVFTLPEEDQQRRMSEIDSIAGWLRGGEWAAEPKSPSPYPRWGRRWE